MHYAIQPIANCGEQFVSPRTDFSHTSLGYDPAKRSFRGKGFRDSGIYIGLDIDDLSLFLSDKHGKKISQKILFDLTLQESFDWLSVELQDSGLSGAEIRFPAYPDFPEHPLRDSARFSDKLKAEIRALHEYYREAYFLIQKFAKAKKIKAPIIIWPHHFDMAILKRLPKIKKDDHYIGVGFSPGDIHYNEPYWYISLWPYPKDSSLLKPLKSPAFWHTKGFVSGILKSNSISEHDLIFEYLDDGYHQAEGILQRLV